MDKSLFDIIEVGMYTGAVIGSVFAVTSWLKRKSDNDTYVARTRVDIDLTRTKMERSEQEKSLVAQRIELMGTEAYREYRTRRENAWDKALREYGTDMWSNAAIKDYLDAQVGPDPLESL
ncbi:MAG: hypothetical protein Q7R96_01645 [Nanoarchaeota archaeon]|nr:hypothetical protein [Nanoarchaeota archaeon]